MNGIDDLPAHNLYVTQQPPVYRTIVLPIHDTDRIATLAYERASLIQQRHRLNAHIEHIERELQALYARQTPDP